MNVFNIFNHLCKNKDILKEKKDGYKYYTFSTIQLPELNKYYDRVLMNS